jgi:hypothetical protein
LRGHPSGDERCGGGGQGGKIASLRAQAVHSQWLVAECLQEFARGKWEAGDWQSDESNPKAFVGALLIGDAIKGIEIISKVLTGSK